MNKKIIIVLVVVIILILITGGVFLFRENNRDVVNNIESNNNFEETMVNDIMEEELEIDTNAIQVKEFIIESYTDIIDGQFSPAFSLKKINVNKGDLVRIKITTISGSHDFKIDEFDIYTETPLNREVVVEFVADKEGEFIYYCTKPNHRDLGHWGTLIVSSVD